MAVSFALYPASEPDLAALQRLLAAAELPIDGLSDQFPTAYVVASMNGELIGAAGLEVYEDLGLLRSVVVADSVRGRGVGRELVQNRLVEARTRALRRVFLLTTTAQAYFSRLGFEPVAREQARGKIADSPEFAHACPASAACLARMP